MNEPPKPSAPPSEHGAVRLARVHAEQHARSLKAVPMQKAPWWDTMRTDPEREYDRMEQAADARKAEREEAVEQGSPLRAVGYGSAEDVHPVRDGDARLRDEVLELLAKTSRDEFTLVEVEVKDGVVTLSGAVENRLLKYRCEEVAEQVDGVKDLVNHLQLAH